MNRQLAVNKLVAFLEEHCVGRANALHAEDLSAALNLPHRLGSRAGNGGGAILRLLVGTATRQGHCIVADKSGYFVPQNAAEAADCLTKLDKAARSVRRRVTTLKKSVALRFAA